MTNNENNSCTIERENVSEEDMDGNSLKRLRGTLSREKFLTKLRELRKSPKQKELLTFSQGNLQRVEKGREPLTQRWKDAIKTYKENT